jgi:hypothetical protein
MPFGRTVGDDDAIGADATERRRLEVHDEASLSIAQQASSRRRMPHCFLDICNLTY